jgi:hypothetical protein
MSINNSQTALPATELIATMTGAPVLIGTLTQNPAIIIFDNLSTVPVTITIGSIQWKTFAAGSAIVLDLRAASGIAPNFTFSQNTPIFGNGASGQFSVSYIYAQNQ